MSLRVGAWLVALLGCTAPAATPAVELGTGDSAPTVFSPVDVWRVGQRWRTIWMPEEWFLGPRQREFEVEYQVISHDSEGTSILVVYRALDGGKEPLVNPEIVEFDAEGVLVDGSRPWSVLSFDVAQEGVRREGDLFIVSTEQMLANDGSPPVRQRTRLQWQVGRPWYDRVQVANASSGSAHPRWLLTEVESTIEFVEEDTQ